MSTGKQQVQTNSQTPPLWYSIMMIAFGVIYLLVELGFNAYLVDTATLNLSLEEIDQLEMFGRSLSGVGLMLLVFGWIKYRSDEKLKTLKQLVIFGLIGFFFMFFGQHMLIEGLVNASSVEQRKDAQYVMLMKQGLVNNAIRIEGVEYDKEEIETPQIKTFLSAVGLMAFIDSDFVSVIKKSSRDIIKTMIESKANINVGESYQKFDIERQKVFEYWDSYVEANKKYKEATSNEQLISEADKAWAKVEKGINAKWAELEDAKAQYASATSIGNANINEAKGSRQKELIENAEYARAYLEDFFEVYRHCEEDGGRYRERCLKKTLELYETNITKYAGSYIDYKEFCTIHPDKRKSLNWEKPFTPKKIYNCPGDQSFIAKKIIDLKTGGEGAESIFIEKTGFNPDVTYEEFLLSERVAKEVRSEVAKEGIVMDENWTPYNKNVFKNAVVNKILTEADKSFAQKSKELAGEPLKPYMKFEEFANLDLIQDRFKESLQVSENVDLYATEKDFYDMTFGTKIEKEIEKQNSLLTEDASLLANGAPNELIGKASLKAVVVPPVAMIFSLFFAVLNAVFITLKIVYLFVHVNKKIQGALAAGFIFAIAYLPLTIGSDLSANSITSYFVQSSQEAIGNASIGFTWLMNFQPVVYPIGNLIF